MWTVLLQRWQCHGQRLVDARVVELQTETANIKTDVGHIRGEVDGVKDSVGGLATRLESLEKEVA